MPLFRKDRAAFCMRKFFQKGIDFFGKIVYN